VGRDEWRYIVPRPFLDGLAGTRTLGRSTQVLVALICKMYGDQENAGSETPAATVTLSSLVKMTGRGRREVQKSIAILYQAGVLTDVEARPGRPKVLSLNPRPKGATPEVGAGAKRGAGPRPKSGAGAGPNRARVPVPESGAPTYKEQRRDLLEETSLQATVDVTDADRVRSSNGHGPALISETIDIQRPTRVRMILTAAVASCSSCRRPVKDRWLAHVKDLSHDLAARDDLSESTIRRRVTEFFATQFWCHLGDSAQAKHLRDHVLKPVRPAKKKAAKPHQGGQS